MNHQPLPEEQRDMAVRLAWSLLWTPYQWAGDDPSAFDCSGMYVAILGYVGSIPLNQDYSAHGLYGVFRGGAQEKPYAGCLVFWWNGTSANKQIVHVEMLIDKYWTIGASGGGRPRFNIRNEIQKDPLLRQFYGHLSEEDIEKRKGDFVIDLIRRELYKKQAIEQNAFIQPHLLNYRGDKYIICDPFADNGTG